jgi:hypothetical protein
MNYVEEQKKITIPKKITDNEGSIITDEYQIAQSFNEFYGSIGEKTISDIKKDALANPYTRNESFSQVNSEFTLKRVEDHTILKTIRNMNGTMSGNLNAIPGLIIKKFSSILVWPIGIIINRSLTNGIFPDSYKIGVVKPIYKKKGGYQKGYKL